MPAKQKTVKKVGDSTPFAWAALRISIGAIFLWAFFDKLFGLGFATCRDAKTDVVTTMCSKAWLEGGSPTYGFLKMAAKGPFAEFYNGLAGNHLIDWLFMMGLLLIGFALVAGIGVKIATMTGSLLLFMMWTAVLPPENNPVLDDHLVYIIALFGVYSANSSQVWGLRKWWVSQEVVKDFPILE